MNKLTDEQMQSLRDYGGECHIIETSDGPCDSYCFHPAGQGPWPAVLFYCDAGGTRPSMFGMARRLADAGYYVLMPNLFHRGGTFAPFDASNLFNNPDEYARLTTLMQTVTKAGAMRDTAACLGFLELQKSASTEAVGAVGYCMGGGLALTAAGTFPEEVRAAASYHGARLANDAPDSPHLLAPRIKGSLYIGVAGIDPHFPDQEKERLQASLQAAGLDFKIEAYQDVHHGFAVPDMPVFDAAASEKHWQSLLNLFSKLAG